VVWLLSNRYSQMGFHMYMYKIEMHHTPKIPNKIMQLTTVSGGRDSHSNQVLLHPCFSH